MGNSVPGLFVVSEDSSERPGTITCLLRIVAEVRSLSLDRYPPGHLSAKAYSESHYSGYENLAVNELKYLELKEIKASTPVLTPERNVN